METIIAEPVETVEAIPVQPNSVMVAAIKESGLEKTKSDRLLELFTPYFGKMSEVERLISTLNKENPTDADVAKAKEIRMALRKNRIASEELKDESKKHIIIEGRVIDSLNNVVKSTSKVLEQQCEDIEKYHERMEKKRQEEQLQSRRAELLPFVDSEDELSIYPLDIMKDEAYRKLFDKLKLAYEAQKERDQKEAIAKAEREEQERKDKEERDRKEAEERERIAAENARLKAEADAREKELAAERAKIEEERRQREAEDKRLREEQEEKLRLEREENEKKLAAERAERERLEAELKAKKDAEEKAERERIEREEEEAKALADAERAAKLAPAKDKIKNWVNSMTIPTIDDDDLSLEMSELICKIRDRFIEFRNYAESVVKGIK